MTGRERGTGLRAAQGLIIVFVALCMALLGAVGLMGGATTTPRVPAEWEQHGATWMQWPGRWEANMRPAFTDIISVVQQYEPVHILTSTMSEQAEAREFLGANGVPKENIDWHVVPIDNAWMRDNGPVYVFDGSRLRVVNWGFDAWGGNFGREVAHLADDRVPQYVAEILGVPVVNRDDYILERGNLESNGAGILMLNWSCQQHRNPGLTQSEQEQILRAALGGETILWAYGYDPADATTGHIDGIARFVSEDVVAIAEYPSQVDFDRLVADCKSAGLEVVRYPGDPNWLIGNGFVAAMSAGSEEDEALRGLLESLFPDRDIHMVDARTIAESGGGIHCVTNDQPALP